MISVLKQNVVLRPTVPFLLNSMTKKITHDTISRGVCSKKYYLLQMGGRLALTPGRQSLNDDEHLLGVEDGGNGEGSQGGSQLYKVMR